MAEVGAAGQVSGGRVIRGSGQGTTAVPQDASMRAALDQVLVANKQIKALENEPDANDPAGKIGAAKLRLYAALDELMGQVSYVANNSQDPAIRSRIPSVLETLNSQVLENLTNQGITLPINLRQTLVNLDYVAKSGGGSAAQTVDEAPPAQHRGWQDRDPVALQRRRERKLDIAQWNAEDRGLGLNPEQRWVRLQQLLESGAITKEQYAHRGAWLLDKSGVTAEQYRNLPSVKAGESEGSGEVAPNRGPSPLPPQERLAALQKGFEAGKIGKDEYAKQYGALLKEMGISQEQANLALGAQAVAQGKGEGGDQGDVVQQFLKNNPEVDHLSETQKAMFSVQQRQNEQQRIVEQLIKLAQQRHDILMAIIRSMGGR